MKIIAGKLKGHKIVTNKRMGLRPTTNMIRESVFNILTSIVNDFDNKNFLDLCCGTGACGFEALSRGVDHATFVDSSNSALEIVRSNANRLKVNNISVVKAKMENIGNILNALYDIVYIDPPYNIQDHIIYESIQSLHAIIHKNTIIIVESTKTLNDIENFKLIDTRIYGKTKISFFNSIHSLCDL